MKFLSHLDLMRLFDRAVRRAGLPISYSGGYHPSPRISPANALSLGATSSGEIVDFELTQTMDLGDFQTKLAAQLPAEIPIYRVEEVEVKSPSATQLLEQAEYLLTVAWVPSPDQSPNPVDEQLSTTQWQQWLDQILGTAEILWEQTTKKGKVKQVNLRDRLLELELLEVNPDAQTSQIRYRGICRNDGTNLRPHQIIYLLEQVTQEQFQLLNIHRQQLILGSGLKEFL